MHPPTTYLHTHLLTYTHTCTQLDPATKQCSLTDHSRQLVLVSLLSELVFVKGQHRTLSLSALPKLYRDHFGCHLSPSSFGVKKIVGLFQLLNVKLSVSTLYIIPRVHYQEYATHAGDKIRHWSFAASLQCVPYYLEYTHPLNCSSTLCVYSSTCSFFW